jgi:hypothetical protein
MAQAMHSRPIRWLLLTLGSLLTASAFAAPPIGFSNLINPAFGDLLAGASGRNFILGTNGSISGTDAADYISGAAAGSLTISGSPTQSISIQASNLIADGGVSIVNVTCNYDATGDQNCITGFSGSPPTSAGKVLLIGVEINTTITHGDNDTAAPSFDIVVNYI